MPQEAAKDQEKAGRRRWAWVFDGGLYEEGQLADLPWPPTRTFRSGEALIFVNDGLCGGCGICVEVCPTHVLGLARRNRPALLDPKGCSGCLQCELLCPDFALVVLRLPGGAAPRAEAA